jgi:hypothetical protein
VIIWHTVVSTFCDLLPIGVKLEGEMMIGPEFSDFLFWIQFTGLTKMSKIDMGMIESDLFLGSEDAEQSNYSILQQYGITHVLTCGFGLSQTHKGKITYHKINAIDLPIYNILIHMQESFDFINSGSNQGNIILVHCARGVSRSATIVIGYLMMKRRISFPEARYRVAKQRSCIKVNNGFKEQLELLEKCKFDPTQAIQEYKKSK